MTTRDADQAAAREFGTPFDAAMRGKFGFDTDSAEWFRSLSARVRRAAMGRLGEFELLAEAGRGGQGLVYRARQDRPAREVALKRMAAGVFATPAMRARFEQEIEAAAALSHPNIVSVYGAHEIDGQLVVALQWIDGEPLDRWARPDGDRPRALSEVLQVFTRICDAVQHAHQRGVLHRDLKPSNILVDDRGEPHVLDFGLARRFDDSSDAGRLTQTGAMLGTPAFAPPEQLRGESALGDVRSDVYSIGAMLYQYLTGTTPIEPTLSPSAALQQIVERGPRPPAALNPAADRELSAIAMKALQADPEQRYASVDALRADLQRRQRGEPVLAHPPSTAYQFRKFVRRNRAAVAVTSGFLLLTTTAATVSTALYMRAERERVRADEKSRQATQALTEAGREAYTTRLIKDFFQEMLLSAGRSGGARGATLTLREMLDRAAEKLESGQETIEPAADAALRMTIANTYRELGMDAAAEPHYRKALALRRGIHGPDSIQVAEALDALGRTYRVLGRLEDAERTVEAAWTAYERSVNPGDPYLARAANSVALVKKSLGKFDEAESWYQEAIRRYVASFGPKSEYLPYALNNLGAMYVTAGRLSDAEPRFRDALALSRELHGDAPHLDTMIAASSLADVLAQREELGPATEALFEESYRGMVAIYGTRHHRVALLLQRYGRYLLASARFQEAAEVLLQASQVLCELERWPSALEASLECAAALRSAGRAPEALWVLGNALDDAGRRVAPDESSLAPLHLEVGALLTDAGRPTEARAHLECAQAIYESAGADSADGLARTRALLAQTRP